MCLLISINLLILFYVESFKYFLINFFLKLEIIFTNDVIKSTSNSSSFNCFASLALIVESVNSAFDIKCNLSDLCLMIKSNR